MMENLALRQQLAVMMRTNTHPRLRNGDRVFWVLASRLWNGRKESLLIVKPETVVKWHRRGFKVFWGWKSRVNKRGRQRISPQIRALARKMAEANPTASFKLLFVLVILSHDRRRILHFNVTANPTARWTAQQMLEAFPWDTAPKYIIRDRDSIPKSPWQNPYAERVIGSIRRECLDHLIVLNERHLKKILTDYIDYYHRDRTHLGLDKDTPEKRPIQQKPANGKVVALPRVGGLHHRYVWKQAA